MPAPTFALMLIAVIAAAGLSLLAASLVGQPFGLLGFGALIAAGLIRLRSWRDQEQGRR